MRLALYAPPVEWVVLQAWSFPRIAAQILSLLVDMITTIARHLTCNVTLFATLWCGRWSPIFGKESPFEAF